MRGEIHVLIRGSRQYRVLVVSNDEFATNPAVAPWGLVITRAAVPDSELFVRLSVDDPLAGAAVLVPAVVTLDRTGLRDNLGYITEATMETVDRRLRDFLALP